jgi:hypothetical protein
VSYHRTIDILLCRPDIAREVFESQHFIERLGDDRGLDVIGMFKRGVIWNNDNASWKVIRDEFTTCQSDALR